MVRIVAGLMLAVLGWIALGGAMTAIAGPPPVRGKMIDIGDGRRMHIVCEGPPAVPGKPTVLFEAGAFGFSADWGVVQQKLAEQGIRSCAYDRAGMGISDPGPAPRDGEHIIGDLEKLLAAAHEDGPFILVGHSMAGLFVRLYYGRNPDKVAGVVLVDATTPEAIDVPLVRQFVGHFAKLSDWAAAGASIGLFKPVSRWGDKIGLGDTAAAAEKRRAFASGPHNRTAAAEVRQWPATAAQARAVSPFPAELPVGVVTAGGATGREGWKSIQAAPARLSKYGYVANVSAAGHATLLGTKFADQIVRAIDHVRRASHALS